MPEHPHALGTENEASSHSDACSVGRLGLSGQRFPFIFSFIPRKNFSQIG